MLGKDLHGRISTIDAARAEQFFDEMKKEKDIYKSNDMMKMLDELEDLFSEKLTSDQVTQMMDLLRIFEGTPTAIQNALVKRTLGIDNFTFHFN